MKNQSVIYTRTAPDRGLVNVATQKGANAYLRQMQKDGKPPFSSKLLVSINQYIHKPEESIEERVKIQLIKTADQTKDSKAGKSILCGLYTIIKTICDNASNDLLREVITDTELRILFNQFVSLFKYAISRENKGVIVDEACLHDAMLLMSRVFESLDPSQDIIQDYLKSLASAAKQAAVVPAQDSGVGYFLCQTMIQCFTVFFTIKKKNDKALMMMHKTGMLEQVLRHIHLPWTTNLLGDLQDGCKNITRFFFLTVASSSASLCSMFKAGSPSRDVLVDVLEGRIKPCAENEHMVEVLEALKKFLDMGLTSGNPDEKYTSMQNYKCTKCDKQDWTRKMLVCGKCQYAGYCSRECQVADWKGHKQTCKRYASGTKTKNLEAIAHRFFKEHHSEILEKLRKIYDGGDLVLDLDFSNQSSPDLPPAFRNPPEFEVFPADIFWNREKKKAPAGHWFFEDLGGGETFYSDEHIQYMRKETENRCKNQDIVPVFIFMLFSDNPIISTAAIGRNVLEAKSDSEHREKSETYQQRRQEYIQQHSDQLAMMLLVNPDVKDLSPFEKEEYAKKFNESMGKLFDLSYNILNKNVISNY